MLEKGWPWDSAEGDTREYGAQEIADAFTSFIKNGVLDAEADFLLTPQSGNTLRISSGTAWINGRMLKLDGFEDIAIPYVSASETPRYGVLGLLLRPDVDHRDFTFFYMPPDGNELPALGENEIAIAKIRYDRGTPAISEDHIIRDVERAYTTNPYYDKKGITMEFLNEVVSSYMEFTPEGIAIYDGPASDTGRKMVFGYDVVEKALRIVGEFTSTPRDINGFILETKVGEVSFVENDESIKKVSGIGVQDVSGNVRAIIGASKPIDTALSDAVSAYMCADGQITIESLPKVNRINAAAGKHYFKGKVRVVVEKIFLKEEGKRGISLLTNEENSAIIFFVSWGANCKVCFKFPVIMARRSHLFPSRTQKLSFSASKVPGW